MRGEGDADSRTWSQCLLAAVSVSVCIAFVFAAASTFCCEARRRGQRDDAPVTEKESSGCPTQRGGYIDERGT